jgi:hypothetical protein
MAYSQFSIDAFRANLINGGARDNLYLVSGVFPGTATGVINAAASVAGAVFGGAVAGAITNVAAAIGLSNPGAQVSFLCRAANIPAATLGQVEVNYMGRKLKYGGDREFADWNIKCYNDGAYQLRKAFESWSNVINSYQGNVGPNNMNSYLCDWYVQPLTREGNPIATYKMVGVWPREIQGSEMNFDSKTNISEFGVSMSYQYHELQDVTT